MEDICFSCNENAITELELYCTNCYLAKNSEIDYDSLDLLWTTKENA